MVGSSYLCKRFLLVPVSVLVYGTEISSSRNYKVINLEVLRRRRWPVVRFYIWTSNVLFTAVKTNHASVGILKHTDGACIQIQLFSIAVLYSTNLNFLYVDRAPLHFNAEVFHPVSEIGKILAAPKLLALPTLLFLRIDTGTSSVAPIFTGSQ